LSAVVHRRAGGCRLGNENYHGEPSHDNSDLEKAFGFHDYFLLEFGLDLEVFGVLQVFLRTAKTSFSGLPP
jgi:hypothetical protein